MKLESSPWKIWKSTKNAFPIPEIDDTMKRFCGCSTMGMSGLWRLSWVSEVASFVSTNPTAGLDVVLECRWFFHGHSFMHFLVDVHRAKQAELLACLYGAKVALESVVVPLIVESEGLEVVSEVNSVMSTFVFRGMQQFHKHLGISTIYMNIPLYRIRRFQLVQRLTRVVASQLSSKMSNPVSCSSNMAERYN
ncbi:hypothetical protein ACLB2K_033042 [Fragaria x ananassa]